MKEFKFIVSERMIITPIDGETTAHIITTGDVNITHPCTGTRLPSTILANTGFATLTKSPAGQNRTLKLIFPGVLISKEFIMKEVEKLVDLALLLGTFK